MATSPRPAPGSLPPDGGPGGRLHIHGITEMPAGYDAEVAELFQGSSVGERTVGGRSRGPARDPHRGGAGAGAGCALCPAPLAGDLPRGGDLWDAAEPRCAAVAAAHLCPGRRRGGRAEPKAMPDVPFMAPPDHVEHEFQGQPAKSQPQAAKSFPMPPRQPAPSPARPPQAAPERRGPGPARPRLPTKAAAPAAALPHQQQPPPWAPQQRGAPPAPPRGVAPQQPQPPQPRQSAPRHEARVPSPPPQPRPRPAVPLPSAPQEEKPAKQKWPWKALVKWGVAALVILGIAAGLWLWLAKPGGLLGSGRLPGSQAPNRPIRARQPPPIQTTRGAGRQTACPAPPI